MQEIPIFDIYEYSYIPFWQTLWFKIIVIALISILGALLAYYIVRRIKQRNMEPWHIALKQIKNLNAHALDGHLFYTNLTSILKKYFEKSYNVGLLAKTDQEIIAILKNKNFSSDTVQDLEHLFLGPERIKFAREMGISEQMAQDQLRAYNLVKKTKPNQGA